jgi:hypothetical protein
MRTILILFVLAAPIQAAETIERLKTADGAVEVFVIRSGDTDMTEVVVVQNGKAARVSVGGGVGLPPVTPPDPPADSTLTTFVRGLTVKVKATDAEREAVADIFTEGARRIRAGELRGSLAIVTWTNTELEAYPEWAAWYKTLMGHVLKLEGLEFPVAAQWATAWAEIGKGVAP